MFIKRKEVNMKPIKKLAIAAAAVAALAVTAYAAEIAYAKIDQGGYYTLYDSSNRAICSTWIGYNVDRGSARVVSVSPTRAAFYIEDTGGNHTYKMTVIVNNSCHKVDTITH